ncbi:MAG: DUF302 domain-containing protein [Deltaproteobacteria bacterium]|jgi:uncharacterized protein (DUF302 family)|nr:DUF302 domain-containing protein [Deltaproteobacteria bacterium]
MALNKTEYGLKKEVDTTYEDTIIKITDELKKEGFGILTEIDVKKTLKAKIDEDFTKYVILGACNPNLAIKALREEIDMGLLLPCNIVVYENPENSKTVVAAIDPSTMLQVTGRDDLKEFSDQVGQKLSSALERV